MMRSVYVVDEQRMKDAVLLWKGYDFGWENLNAWQKILVGTRSSCSRVGWRPESSLLILFLLPFPPFLGVRCLSSSFVQWQPIFFPLWHATSFEQYCLAAQKVELVRTHSVGSQSLPAPS